MTIRLHKEIEKLKKRILALGGVVEESLRLAVKAIDEGDAILAAKVVKDDNVIDQMEVDTEEECLKTLALHQPVAVDLRFIVAALKLNNDLERIGDYCANIAESAIFLAGRKKVEIPFDFGQMSETVQTMLKWSLDSLVNMDSELAIKVCKMDDQVDRINREMYHRVAEGIRKHPDDLESLLHYLTTSRRLERIADHCTNIAEDVIYMINGEIIRHKGNAQKQQ